MNRTFHAERLLGLLMVGLAASVPVAWIVGGYLELPVTEVLGFKVRDGLCDVGDELVGEHCFSDFTVVSQVLAATTPWDPGSTMATAYPATGWLIPVIVYLIGTPIGGVPFATLLFVSVGIAVALVPAIWAGLPDWRLNLPAALLVLGFGALPLLIASDRGNAIVFIVLPVFVLVIGLLRDQRSWVIAGIALATIIKPQLILFALVFIPSRRARDFVLTLVWSGAGILAGFLVWPGDRIENIQHWLRNLVGYSDYGVVDVLYPYNLSISRTILTVSDFSGFSELVGEENRGHLINLLTSFSFVPGLVILIATILFLFVRGRNLDTLSIAFIAIVVSIIVPGTSFSYYVILLIPVAAVLLRNPIATAEKNAKGRWIGYLDSPTLAQSRVGRFRFWILASVVLLTTVPLVIPVPEEVLPGVVGATHVGLLQILWGPALVLAWLLALSSSFGRSDALVNSGTVEETNPASGS